MSVESLGADLPMRIDGSLYLLPKSARPFLDHDVSNCRRVRRDRQYARSRVLSVADRVDSRNSARNTELALDESKPLHTDEVKSEKLFPPSTRRDGQRNTYIPYDRNL